ncbi:ribosome biogenesis GTPase YlqF [Ruminococcus sp.]|uniref:ribosome biogenesis GTPase YlqF n=1 Tax=Ruminococcus sp. TaxID=41978 RepID=UPI002611D15E|nr:ribosome biogenesis GTPase YlqF [Ruminococcus sp.]MDD6988120.1 ribosome biogenesis GTPase YlqF [Ruminococcus sp.]MDY6202618.1 ribosome biogenesis GTPase YlqF [Ruminococcus sp.]
MSEMQNIQWFPGHMTKTKRQIQSSLKLVDAVAEIIDARIPISSRNPDLAKLIQNKPRIILLNKCDMANQTATKMWIDHFEKQGITAIAVDCKSGRGLNKFAPAVNKVMSERINRLKAKGMVNPMMRIMIVGIPNVGKSSFINKIAKQNRAKVEDRPGVTRGNQWFTIAKNLEMLDTPGVLWPKFNDKIVGEHLAFTGAVKDQILDIELLAVRLLDFLKELKPADFISRFKLEETDLDIIDSYELLKVIARKRGMLVSGGEVNTERASIMLLDEFRCAKLGRITVEMPNGVLK